MPFESYIQAFETPVTLTCAIKGNRKVETIYLNIPKFKKCSFKATASNDSDVHASPEYETKGAVQTVSTHCCSMGPTLRKACLGLQSNTVVS